MHALSGLKFVWVAMCSKIPNMYKNRIKRDNLGINSFIKSMT